MTLVSICNDRPAPAETRSEIAELLERTYQSLDFDDRFALADDICEVLTSMIVRLREAVKSGLWTPAS